MSSEAIMNPVSVVQLPWKPQSRKTSECSRVAAATKEIVISWLQCRVHGQEGWIWPHNMYSYSLVSKMLKFLLSCRVVSKKLVKSLLHSILLTMLIFKEKKSLFLYSICYTFLHPLITKYDNSPFFIHNIIMTWVYLHEPGSVGGNLEGKANYPIIY